MNRKTIKTGQKTYEIIDSSGVNKLGRLEDIEENYKINLEALFKVFKPIKGRTLHLNVDDVEIDSHKVTLKIKNLDKFFDSIEINGTKYAKKGK